MSVTSRQLGAALLALILILLAISLSILTYDEKSFFATFSLASMTLTHWSAYIGGLWIAIETPIYYFLKHRNPRKLKLMLKIHVFGNLIAFALISVHFTYQQSLSQFLGTGSALYVAVVSLVITGLMQRFNMMKNLTRQIKYVHSGLATAFYLLLIIHILGTFIRL